MYVIKTTLVGNLQLIGNICVEHIRETPPFQFAMETRTLNPSVVAIAISLLLTVRDLFANKREI